MSICIWFTLCPFKQKSNQLTSYNHSVDEAIHITSLTEMLRVYNRKCSLEMDIQWVNACDISSMTLRRKSKVTLKTSLSYLMYISQTTLWSHASYTESILNFTNNKVTK